MYLNITHSMIYYLTQPRYFVEKSGFAVRDCAWHVALGCTRCVRSIVLSGTGERRRRVSNKTTSLTYFWSVCERASSARHRPQCAVCGAHARLCSTRSRSAAVNGPADRSSACRAGEWDRHVLRAAVLGGGGHTGDSIYLLSVCILVLDGAP